MALGDVIARLSVSLGLDTVAFEKGATLAEKRMAQTQRKFEKMGRKIGDMGKTLSIGLTAPLAAFGVSSFNAASDAAELQSAFDQTFGDLAASMNEWAEATGNAMGRSTQELQRAANTFGIFFNQAAPTREEAAKMSQTFTVLAQDLASFYNVSESDALQKLRSGLSGEAEPLRDFGVFLSAAQVEAKGLEMGLGGLSGELSEQEKIMARYALILESTKNAQGDVARTSDGTANKMREAKAAFEELQVVVGTKLLPAITPLIGKLAGLIDWFTQLPAPVQEGALVVAAIAAALGPLLLVVGQLTTAIPLLMKALTFLFAHPVILGAAVLISGIYLAWKNWDKITAIVQNLYQGVKKWLVDKLGAVLNWVNDKVKAVEETFAWLYDRVVGNSWIPDMVSEVGDHMAKLDSLMVDPATKATQKTDEAFRALAGNVSTLLDRLFPKIAELRAMKEDLATIDAGVAAGLLSPELGQEARFRAMGGGRRMEVSDGLLNAPSLIEGMDKVQTKLRGLGDSAREQTVRIAKTFKDMADETASALARMSDVIKGGGFLDILQGVLGLGLQLGSIGVFGSKIAGNINKSVPGYATGTNFHPGGLAMVGERGPELVSMPRGSRVFTNRESMGMMGGSQPVVVQVVAGEMFDARVVQGAAKVVEIMAPGMVSASSARARMDAARPVTPGGATG